jgi:hypothetical protein
MKPGKVFFYFAIFYACLLLLDWLKATIFLVHFHSAILKLKEIILVGGGLLLMKITLPSKKAFTAFALIYSILLVIYYLLKVLIHYAPHGTAETISNILNQYLLYTELMTPLPFIIYWIVVKVYEEQNKKVIEKEA